ncbi:MAG: phenylalanine--tRNA ligase subunit beta [Microgenomates group bacterium]
MNILVPYSWLKEYLKTTANYKQIADYLSLCSQSVEKIIPQKDDYIYEIEITTNRSDCLSVYGIARELSAILPQFKIKAELKPIEIKEIPLVEKSLPLDVTITKESLCPRFTALIFDEVKIGPSPKIIQERLEKSGIRALNNVVDISNYLMLELGQPMHTFDYDKILRAKMILREAKEGEEIITLDGQKRILPQGAIIIEDGKRRIIDLCGIMGGENSAVDKSTKRVLLFIQTYDPARIRQTCQKLSFRTEAAQRFEKGVDPEGVILAMKRAILLFEKNCQAKVASKLIDIYPHPPQFPKIKLTQEKLNQVMGISFSLKKGEEILKNLGFKVKTFSNYLEAIPPHWRLGDINIPEDLIEEIARIYGYHRLPSILPQGEIPLRPKNNLFYWEEKIKEMLKYWGFTETVNYSMISKKWLENLSILPKNCLKVANPLSEEWEYLRISLIPSLLEVIRKNKIYQEIKIFEIANIYLPQGKNKLPQEISTLTIAINKSDFFYLKGILENIVKEMGIEKMVFKNLSLKSGFYSQLISSNRGAEILLNNELIGILGEIKPEILEKFSLEESVTILEINLEKLVKFHNPIKKYTPLSNFPPVIEDLAFVFDKKINVETVIQLIKQVSPIIKTVELIDYFKNTRTFRITYQSEERNLSDEEIKVIREKIISQLKEKLGIVLKN